MKTYKATNGVNTYLNNFADLAAAEIAFASLVSDGYILSEAGSEEQMPEIVISSSEKRKQRAEFGEELYNQYLDENDQIAYDRGYPFTVQEANTQAAKLQLVGLHLKNGSFVQAIEMLNVTDPDPILTQERIDYFKTELQNFLNNQ